MKCFVSYSFLLLVSPLSCSLCARRTIWLLMLPGLIRPRVLGAMSCPSSSLQGNALLYLLAPCPADIGSWSLRLITSHFITLGFGSTPSRAAGLIPFQLSSCGCCGHSEACPWLPGYPKSVSQLCSPLSPVQQPLWHSPQPSPQPPLDIATLWLTTLPSYHIIL